MQAMIKQDAAFAWHEMVNFNFQKIKELIAKIAAQPLRYYDRTKPVTIEANAAQRTYTSLVQEGQLKVFASQRLTDNETRYANKNNY